MTQFKRGDLGHVIEHNRLAGLALTPSGADVAPLIADRFAAGHLEVALPSGSFTASAPIEVPAMGTLRGAGGYGPGMTAATTITTNHAGHGIVLTGDGATVQQLQIVGGASTGTEADGVHVAGSRCSVEHVRSRAFGRDGISVDSTPEGRNLNLTRVARCRTDRNGRHGLYLAGSNSNVTFVDQLDAVANTEWGIHSESAKNTFLAPHASQNGVGAYRDRGGSSVWLNPYVEGGTGAQVEVKSDRYTVWLDSYYATPGFEMDGTSATALVARRGHLFAPIVRARRGGLLLRDANGAEWSVTVGTDGTLAATPASPNVPPPY